MSSVQELAPVFFPFLRGLVHELNNPLTGILGYAQLLKEDFPEGSPERDDLEEIHRSSQRCRELVALLGRVACAAEESSTFSPAQLHADLIRLLEPMVRKREIPFTVKEAESLPSLAEGSYGKTLGMLLAAALEVFEVSRTLTLETRNAEEGAELCLAFSASASAVTSTVAHPHELGACVLVRFKAHEECGE